MKAIFKYIYPVFICALFLASCKNKEYLVKQYPDQIIGKWGIEIIEVGEEVYPTAVLDNQPFINFKEDGTMTYFLGDIEEETSFKVEGSRIVNPDKADDDVMLIEFFSRSELRVTSEEAEDEKLRLHLKRAK